ncbi:hypothetical protein GGI43DRAFT_416467 [Trichoderma evansii]
MLRAGTLTVGATAAGAGVITPAAMIGNVSASAQLLFWCGVGVAGVSTAVVGVSLVGYAGYRWWYDKSVEEEQVQDKVERLLLPD